MASLGVFKMKLPSSDFTQLVTRYEENFHCIAKVCGLDRPVSVYLLGAAVHASL